MSSYKLRFGEIKIINPHLAEVIINEGVVMDEIMVDEYHDFLIPNLKAPFSLLINKQFSYTYTFNAQRIIGSLNQIKAMAIVIHSRVTKMATDVLIEMNKENSWNIKLFGTREEALKWLIEIY